MSLKRPRSKICFLTVASTIYLMAGSARFARADVVFTESFESYQSEFSGTQAHTGLDIYHSGSVSGWIGTGVNHSHAVDLDRTPASNYALQIFSGNSSENPNTLTLSSGVAANRAGATYRVSFDTGPSVWRGTDQATTAADGIRIEILRANNSVLASLRHQTGVWDETLDAQKLSSPGVFDYAGDGSGNIRVRLSADPMFSTNFGGAIDNLTISRIQIPEPGSLLLLLIGGVGTFTRTSRTTATGFCESQS